MAREPSSLPSVGAVYLAGLTALAGSVWYLPSLFVRGFPLDDAWIHAVYARELAQSWMYAYNPGEASTGATSQLWPLLLAPLHWVSADTNVFIIANKLLGFTLHISSAALITHVYARYTDHPRWVAWTTGLLVALHPDLFAASISGMEVALAEFAVAIALLATFIQNPYLGAFAGAVAMFTRPEIALVAVVLPALRASPRGLRAGFRRLLPIACGSLLAMTTLVARNLAVSGRSLPATFYVKVGAPTPSRVTSVLDGITKLCDTLLLVDSGLLLVASTTGALFSIYRAYRSRSDSPIHAVLIIAGVLSMVVSFCLVAPVDPDAFYHQRYALPGMAAYLFGLPALLCSLLATHTSKREVYAAVLGCSGLLVGVAYLVDYPSRLVRLDNDSRNIDQIQVAMGKKLETKWDKAVVWTVDAGAVRYFARGYVVDMVGLNSAQILGPNKQRYLDAHKPSYLAILPGLSELEETSIKLSGIELKTDAPYTVTGSTAMARQYLLHCKPGAEGTIRVYFHTGRSGRALGFRCAK